MATPINPSNPAQRSPNLRLEVESKTQERLGVKASSPVSTHDALDPTSRRDIGQTDSPGNVVTGCDPSGAAQEAAVAGLEQLGALLSENLKPSASETSDAGDVDPNLDSGAAIGSNVLKNLPGKFQDMLDDSTGDFVIPPGVLDAMKGITDAAAAEQSAAAEGAIKGDVATVPDLSDLIQGIATTPAPTAPDIELPNNVIAPLTKLIEGDYPIDIMAFVQWVLRESYLETTLSLRDFADKVRFHNDQKEAVRNELDRVRGVLSNNPDAESTDQVGPFESGTFNEQYLGDREPEVSSKQLANVVKGEFKMVKLRQFGEILNRPTIATHELKTNGSANGHGASVDDTDALQRALNRCVDEFMIKFEKLSPAEQEALIKSMEADGMLIWVEGADLEVNKPELRTEGSKTDPVKKSHKESVKEFLKRHLEAVRDNLKDWFRNEADTWSDGDVGAVTYTVQFANTQVEIDSQSNRARVETHSSGTSTQSRPHFKAGDTVNTKAEAEAYLEYLENRLNTIGDDAQLANVDLQNWLQKQQQTLQMMSTISKQLHDTAMAIIRKMGG